MPEILDIDLIAFEQGGLSTRKAIVEGTMRSLSSGFVYVRHDLPSSLLDDAYGKLTEFFALPKERKDYYTVIGSNGNIGYTGLLVETAAISAIPDWKEMLNWSAPIPKGHPLRQRFPDRYSDPVLPDEDVPGISAVLFQLHHATLELQRRVLRIVAAGLGIHESYFNIMLQDGSALNRALHYPPMAHAPTQNHVWSAQHGDINLITALLRASTAGLQIKTPNGWINAAPPDQHAIVNTGIMLEHITNGVIPAGIHRVAAQGSNERYSIVQFCHPTPWTMLAPIPTCITPKNPLRYPTIMVSDQLDQVIWEINMAESKKRLTG